MVVRALIVFLALTAASATVTLAQRTEYLPQRKTFNQFPRQIGEWASRGEDAEFDERTLAILGIDDYVSRLYFTPSGAGIGLYIGYYQSQKRGGAIHSPQNCLPGAGWEPVSNTRLSLPSGSDAQPRIHVNRYVIQKGLDRQLVLYWYQSHGRAVASEYWSKFFLVSDAIRLGRTDAALVRIVTPLGRGDAGERRAEETASAFARNAYPLLAEYLPL
jgi:EpsI family protein